MSNFRVWSRLSMLQVVMGTALVILAAVGSAQAQDLAALVGSAASYTNGITVTPNVQVGYQGLGLRFNLPATRDPSGIPWSSTLDLALKRADLWCGSLEAVIAFPSGLSFHLKGMTNLKANSKVYERQEHEEGGYQGVHWKAEKVDWWTIDGRLMYRCRPGLSAGIGLRREYLSFYLIEPTTDDGMPLSFDDSGTIVPGFTYERSWRYSSNFVSKLWIPYLGIDFIGNGYRASLIASPFASVDVRIPARLFTDLNTFVFGSPSGELISDEQLEYRVMKPAVFLEANLSHDFNVSEAFQLSVWGTASWLSLRGKGSWNYYFSLASPPFPAGIDQESERNTATYGRYLLSGGLSAIVPF